MNGLLSLVVKNRLMCDLCGKTFKMKHELARHVRYTHSDAHNYKCNLCERAFKAPSTLKRHIQTFHSTVRNHHCDGKPITFPCFPELHSLVHIPCSLSGQLQDRR